MPQQSNKAVHRLLISRLVISAVVVSVLVSILVIINARDKVSEIAMDRARQGALNISVLAADILNDGDLVTVDGHLGIVTVGATDFELELRS